MSSPISATTRALGIPELVLQVVSHLAQDDLAKAVRVNHEFRAQCELVLYDEPFELVSGGDAELYLAKLELLVRTLLARPDLANRVRSIHPLLAAEVLLEGDVQAFQLWLQLFNLCPNLRRVCLGGNLSSAYSQLLPILAIYRPQLVTLLIMFFPTFTERQDALRFSVMAPYLASMDSLTELLLMGCDLRKNDTVGWPLPKFQLKELSISFTVNLPQDHVAIADLNWFVHSSRDSLRRLTLLGCNLDVLLDVANWGQGLELVIVRVNPKDLERDTRVIGQLGRLPRMRRVFLTFGRGLRGGEAIRKAAAEVNKELGREVVEVSMD